MLEGDTRISVVAELNMHMIWKEWIEDKRSCKMEEPHKQTRHQKGERFMKSYSLKLVLCFTAYLDSMVSYIWKHDCVKWRKLKEILNLEKLEKFIIALALKWD